MKEGCEVMGRESTSHAPLQFLNSWKEIANYLGKGVRTVQRYEHDFALPVRRPANKPRGSVIAVKIEIDAWVKAFPVGDVYPLSRTKADSNPSIIQKLNANAVRMCELCKEMVGLRAQLDVTRNELRHSLATLRQQLKRPETPRDEIFELLLPKGASTRVQ